MSKFSKDRGADPNDPNKKDPLDFILWQSSKPGEPSWVAPFGKGKPGWHIECSAMIYQYLGAQIDIHGGGADLIYPHHESEIAQSESYSKKSSAYTSKPPFVQTCVHIAMLKYQAEKMSKSLGNLVLVKDLLQKYSPNALRWLLLSHHYRQEWEFKLEELDRADELVSRLCAVHGKPGSIQPNQTSLAFERSLENDFNTPQALKIIQTTKHKPTQKQLLKILGFKLS